MAHIKVIRNDAGNCVNFVGTSNPAYWNACLSAQLNTEDNSRIDVINDIRTQEEGETVYEFFAVPYTDFSDADGNGFATATEAAAYITEKANVHSNTGSFVLTANETMGFSLDATSTSIIFTNGDSYGVNTIKAVDTGDGLITIKQNTDEGAVLYSGLHHGNASINGSPIAGGLIDVINTLNELFTVGPFEAVVITDPQATTVANVGGENATITSTGSTQDPIGDNVYNWDGTGNAYNSAMVWSSESIDQTGEYFTFDINGSRGTYGFGIFDVNETDERYSPELNGVYNGSNSGHWNYLWSFWFHTGNQGPWTFYGKQPGYSMLSGWAGFNASDERVGYIAGDNVKIKVGINEQGFVEVSYYDNSESEFVPMARSNYTLPEGEYKLLVKMSDVRANIATAPKVHLRPEEAPTLYYRYIESPDNNFFYPLFATEEEANYVDTLNGGAEPGTSHTHTFDDDPTNTTWYMPTNGGTHVGTSAPTGSEYTEITSVTNADLTPAAYSNADLTYQEGSTVNLPMAPVDVTYTTSVDISPAGSGLVYNTSTQMLQGTLADVATDTDYTITVTRANSYGSSVGSFTLTVTDETPVSTNSTSWTKALDFSGSNEHAAQVTTNVNWTPLNMDSVSNLVLGGSAGYTSNDSNSRPWATAIVFNPDGASNNQHIWNMGEGAGSTDDNIYVRMTAQRQVYFGWGRDGALNECYLGTISANSWHGLYVAHTGERLSGANATANGLADCFDIRWVTLSSQTAQLNRSQASNWTSTGGRMDRQFTGQLTIGGRGSNRNYHGKVASMVVTTLERNVAMPTNAEIEAMVTDPVGWLNTYKVGNSYRQPQNSNSSTGFNLTGTGANATQVWLMGDGASDSYANGIRNEVYRNNQNETKLQLNSMVSNDIQTVSIGGLS